MDQYDRTSGGTGTGGTANTPPFGAETGAMGTAADHQIESETGATHGATTGGIGGTSGSSQSGGGGTATQVDTEQLTERANEMAGRAEDKLNQGMQQAADRIDTMAQRLNQVADERLGSGNMARVGDTAHTVADTMQSLSEYLRNNDAQALRSDLERQMRERPVQTLLVAVAAGWLVGKILR